MKKKIISLILAVCMTLGLAACNNAPVNGAGNEAGKDEEGKEGDAGMGLNFDLFSGADTDTNATSEIMTVTINGEKYDLSDEFQKVVGEMVKNGLQPIEPSQMIEYDENGKYLKVYKLSDYTDSITVIFARESSIISFNPEICPIIVDEYLFYEKYNCTFKTADGITQDSDEDDLKELEGYVPYRGIRGVRGEACIALYVDGKIVDLEEYRDEYEAWLKDAEEEGTASASKNRLDAKYYPLYSRMQEICSLDSIERCIELPYLEEEMLLTFAMQEACEKLEAKEIESFDIVHYSYEPEGMAVQFYHYYYDENWNSSKFRREE